MFHYPPNFLEVNPLNSWQDSSLVIMRVDTNFESELIQYVVNGNSTAIDLNFTSAEVDSFKRPSGKVLLDSHTSCPAKTPFRSNRKTRKERQ